MPAGDGHDRLLAPHATASLLESAASYLHGRARYADARPLFERALAIRQARPGPDHPDTARTLSGLADILVAQGDLDGARPLFERALAIRETRLGPDHPHTAESRRQLAALTSDLEGAE